MEHDRRAARRGHRHSAVKGRRRLARRPLFATLRFVMPVASQTSKPLVPNPYASRDRPNASEAHHRQPATRATNSSRWAGLHVLEKCQRVVGALVVGDRPDEARPVDVNELYVRLVLTSRTEAGHSLGRVLIKKAAELGRERKAELLRVDCWAGAPSLLAWYEICGF